MNDHEERRDSASQQMHMHEHLHCPDETSNQSAFRLLVMISESPTLSAPCGPKLILGLLGRVGTLRGPLPLILPTRPSESSPAMATGSSGKTESGTAGTPPRTAIPLGFKPRPDI